MADSGANNTAAAAATPSDVGTQSAGVEVLEPVSVPAAAAGADEGVAEEAGAAIGIEERGAPGDEDAQSVADAASVAEDVGVEPGDGTGEGAAAAEEPDIAPVSVDARGAAGSAARSGSGSSNATEAMGAAPEVPDAIEGAQSPAPASRADGAVDAAAAATSAAAAAASGTGGGDEAVPEDVVAAPASPAVAGEAAGGTAPGGGGTPADETAARERGEDEYSQSGFCSEDEDVADDVARAAAASRIGAVAKGRAARKDLAEQKAAAAKIGAVAKGRTARKEVEALRADRAAAQGAASAASGDTSTADSAAPTGAATAAPTRDGPELDAEQAAAAAKIGAVAKGRATRKELAEKQAAAEKIGAVAKGRAARKEVEALKEAAKPESDTARASDGAPAATEVDSAEADSAALDAGAEVDAEQAAAAAKIGAVAKGRATRKELAEKQAAAEKIGAVAKGRAARKEIQALKAQEDSDMSAGGGTAPSEPAANGEAAEVGASAPGELPAAADTDNSDAAAQEAAAAKIGAVAKGRAVRKEVAALKAEADAATADAGAAETADTDSGAPNTANGGRADTNDADAEQAAAAAKIGAVAKGRATRKELAEKQAAAERIGAAAKGRAVRKEVAALKAEQQNAASTADAVDAARVTPTTGEIGDEVDAEQAAAAAKIGAVAKGRATRKEMAEKQAAAEKIGAVAKGRAARKQLQDVKVEQAQHDVAPETEASTKSTTSQVAVPPVDLTRPLRVRSTSMKPKPPSPLSSSAKDLLVEPRVQPGVLPPRGRGSSSVRSGDLLNEGAGAAADGAGSGGTPSDADSLAQETPAADRATPTVDTSGKEESDGSSPVGNEEGALADDGGSGAVAGAGTTATVATGASPGRGSKPPEVPPVITGPSRGVRTHDSVIDAPAARAGDKAAAGAGAQQSAPTRSKGSNVASPDGGDGPSESPGRRVLSERSSSMGSSPGRSPTHAVKGSAVARVMAQEGVGGSVSQRGGKGGADPVIEPPSLVVVAPSGPVVPALNMKAITPKHSHPHMQPAGGFQGTHASAGAKPHAAGPAAGGRKRHGQGHRHGHGGASKQADFSAEATRASAMELLQQMREEGEARDAEEERLRRKQARRRKQQQARIDAKVKARIEARQRGDGPDGTTGIVMMSKTQDRPPAVPLPGAAAGKAKKVPSLPSLVKKSSGGGGGGGKARAGGKGKSKTGVKRKMSAAPEDDDDARTRSGIASGSASGDFGDGAPGPGESSVLSTMMRALGSSGELDLGDDGLDGAADSPGKGSKRGTEKDKSSSKGGDGDGDSRSAEQSSTRNVGSPTTQSSVGVGSLLPAPPSPTALDSGYSTPTAVPRLPLMGIGGNKPKRGGGVGGAPGDGGAAHGKGRGRGFGLSKSSTTVSGPFGSSAGSGSNSGMITKLGPAPGTESAQAIMKRLSPYGVISPEAAQRVHRQVRKRDRAKRDRAAGIRGGGGGRAAVRQLRATDPSPYGRRVAPPQYAHEHGRRHGHKHGHGKGHAHGDAGSGGDDGNAGHAFDGPAAAWESSGPLPPVLAEEPAGELENGDVSIGPGGAGAAGGAPVAAAGVSGDAKAAPSESKAHASDAGNAAADAKPAGGAGAPSRAPKAAVGAGYKVAKGGKKAPAAGAGRSHGHAKAAGGKGKAHPSHQARKPKGGHKDKSKAKASKALAKATAAGSSAAIETGGDKPLDGAEESRLRQVDYKHMELKAMGDTDDAAVRLGFVPPPEGLPGMSDSEEEDMVGGIGAGAGMAGAGFDALGSAPPVPAGEDPDSRLGTGFLPSQADGEFVLPRISTKDIRTG